MRLRLARSACWLLASVWLTALASAQPPQVSAAPVVQFTEAETAWIAAHPVLRVLSDSGAPPFDFIDEQGAHAGLAVEWLQELATLSGLRLQWVSQPRRDQLVAAALGGGGDLLIAYGLSVPVQAGFRPLRPVLAYDYPVLVTRLLPVGAPLAAPQRLALVRGYAPAEDYAKKLPAGQRMLTENFEPALAEVAAGHADAAVQGLAVAEWLIRHRSLANLRIAGPLGSGTAQSGWARDWHWQVAPTAAPLASILEKAWAALPAQRAEALRQRWLPAQLAPLAQPAQAPFNPAWWLLLAVVLALAGLLGWRWRRPARPTVERGNEAEFERILEQGPGMVFELLMRQDGQLLATYVTREARRLFGIEAADALIDAASGRQPDSREIPFEVFLRRMIPEDQPLVLATIKASAETQKRRELAYRVAGPRGLRWVKSIIQPRRVADGTAWLGVTVDISDLKRAETQIENSERRLREITDSVPGVIYQLQRETDGRYRLNFASAAMASLRGINPQSSELEGELIFNGIHEGDRERVLGMIEQAAVNLLPYDIEYRVRMPDGQIEWLHCKATPQRLSSGAVLFNGFTNNVTRLKLIEQKLEDTQRLVRDVTDHLPGFVYQFIWDDDGGTRGRLSFVSEGVEVLGYGREQVLADGRLLYAALQPADAQAMRQAIEQSAQSLLPFRMDYVIRSPAGLTTWMRTQASPRRQPGGGMVWNGMTININEEKLRQIEALHVQQRLQSISDTLPGMVFQRVESTEGEIAYPYVSGAVRELFGLTPEQAMCSAEALQARILAADRGLLNLAFDLSRERGGVVQQEFRVRDLDGGLRWVRLLAQFNPESGLPVWNGFAQDITVQKQAQERADALQRRLLEITANVPCVVFQLQRDFEGEMQLLFISDSVYVQTGISREAALENVQTLLGLILPEELPGVLATLEAAHSQARPQIHDFRFRGTDGEVRWLRGSVSVPHSEDGGLVWDGAWQDITDIKELQTELDEAKRAAEFASRLKSEFLANMSHEIRTPMNAIIGLGQLVLQTPLNPRQQDYLGKINTASQSLLGIINDILDISKIEAGKMTLEATAFDLNGVFDKLAAVMNLKAIEKDLELLFDVDPATPLQLIGDPLRLGQVLINLTANALKFSERGMVRIVVRQVRPSDADEALVTMLMFEVQDEGIGMSSEQLARLFQSFAQGDTSTTRKYGGTGLGLSISRNLVRLMGGDIEVRSQPGQGSVFRFQLPFGLAPQFAVLPAPPWPGLCAFVAADDGRMREALASWLRHWGLLVTVIEDAQNLLASLAAAEAQGLPCQLLLLDWRLSGYSGVELGKRIRGLKLAAPPALLLTTPQVNDDAQSEAEQAGIRDLLSKPFSPAALRQAVQRAFGNETLVAQRQLPAAPLLKAVTPASPLPPQDLTAPVFDAAAALLRAGGNAELFTQLLLRFESEHRESPQLLERALLAGDQALALREAHTLKGVAGNLGARRLAAAAAELEAVLRNGPDPLPALARLHIEHLEALRAMRETALVRAAEIAAASEIEPALAELEYLLQAHDADAREAFDRVVAALRPASPLPLVLLRTAVEAYEFETAVAALRDLRLALNLGVTPIAKTPAAKPQEPS